MSPTGKQMVDENIGVVKGQRAKINTSIGETTKH